MLDGNTWYHNYAKKTQKKQKQTLEQLYKNVNVQRI